MIPVLFVTIWAYFMAMYLPPLIVAPSLFKYYVGLFFTSLFLEVFFGRISKLCLIVPVVTSVFFGMHWYRVTEVSRVEAALQEINRPSSFRYDPQVHAVLFPSVDEAKKFVLESALDEAFAERDDRTSRFVFLEPEHCTLFKRQLHSSGPGFGAIFQLTSVDMRALEKGCVVEEIRIRPARGIEIVKVTGPRKPEHKPFHRLPIHQVYALTHGPNEIARYEGGGITNSDTYRQLKGMPDGYDYDRFPRPSNILLNIPVRNFNDVSLLETTRRFEASSKRYKHLDKMYKEFHLIKGDELYNSFDNAPRVVD